MEKRTLFLLFLLLIGIIPTQSQSWDNIRNNKNEYLSGEGYGETVAEADKNALNDLTSQITIQINSDITSIDNESVRDNDITTESYFHAKV